MRHYQKFLPCRDGMVIDIENMDVPEIVTKIAALARERGVKVTLSEEIDGANILLNYAALEGRLTLNDLILVISSTFAKSEAEKSVVERIVVEFFCGALREKVFLENVLRDLKKLDVDFGERLSRPLNKMTQEQREAYARLRILGFVKKGRRGYYVIPRSAAEERIRVLSKSYGDYKSAIGSLIQGSRQAMAVASLLYNNLLSYIDLDEMSVPKIVELYKSIKGREVQRAIAKTLAERLDNGWGISSRDAASMLEILEKHGLLNHRRIAKLLQLDSRLAIQLSKTYGKEAILGIAASLAREGPDLAAQIAAYALGLKGSERDAFIAAYKRGEELQSSHAIDKYKRITGIEQALLRFFESGDEAYLDIVQAELEKITSQYPDDRLVKRVATEVRAVIEGDLSVLVGSKVLSFDTYTVFNMLHHLYTNSRNRRLRLQALYLMQLLWYKTLRRSHGLAVKRYTNTADNDRGLTVNSRESVYNMVRLVEPYIVWRKPLRSRQLILVVDKSASMRQYAFYTLLSAAALAPYVRRVVLFDSNVFVLDRLDKYVHKPRRLLDIIFSTRFEGYTDISKALEVAVKGLSPQTLVLVSDLKQTVATNTKPVEVIKACAEKGWVIHIIASSRADLEAYKSLVKEARVAIHVVDRLSDLKATIKKIVLT